jgi:hypothetical protein
MCVATTTTTTRHNFGRAEGSQGKKESDTTKVLPAITSMCTYNAWPGRATLLPPPTLTGRRASPSSNIRSTTHELLSFLRFFEKPWAKPLPHIFLSGQNELVFNYYFVVQRNHGTYTYYTYRPDYLVATSVLCFAASSLLWVCGDKHTSVKFTHLGLFSISCQTKVWCNTLKYLKKEKKKKHKISVVSGNLNKVK